jgi:hypothetical protein
MSSRTHDRQPSQQGRVLLWAVILGLLAWNLTRDWISLTTLGPTWSVDFAGYWSATRIFLSNGNPYNPTEVLSMLRSIGWNDPLALVMWNPPWMFVLLTPFALLRFWPARWAWLIFHGLLIAVAGDWLWKQSGGPKDLRWISWLGAIVFVPTALALNIGQISPLLLTGLVGFLWAVERKRFLVAGIFTFLLTLKPHVLLVFWIFLILWILAERAWKVLAGAAATWIPAAVFTYMINPTLYRHYVASTASQYGPIIWETPALGTALRMAFPGAGNWLQFLPTILGVTAIVALWQKWHGNFDWQHRLIPILFVSTIAAPYTWTIDWVVLVPLVIQVLVSYQRNPGHNWPPALALLLIQLGLIVQAYYATTYFVTIWVPFALAMVYWLDKHSRAPIVAG